MFLGSVILGVLTGAGAAIGAYTLFDASIVAAILVYALVGSSSIGAFAALSLLGAKVVKLRRRERDPKAFKGTADAH